MHPCCTASPSLDVCVDDMETAAIAVQRTARGLSGRRLASAEKHHEVRGWLSRQGYSGCFSRCWFLMAGPQLRCYRDESERRLLGAVELSSARCFCTVSHAGRAFCFRINLSTSWSSVSLLLAAESEDERLLWVTAILRHASVHNHAPSPSSSPSRRTARMLFLYGRGGGGHKASANAVRDCLAQDEGGVRCDVQLEDIGRLLEAPVIGERVKRFFNWLGMPGGDDIYNFFMSIGWYRMANMSTKLGARTIDSKAVAIGDWLCGYLAAERPSVVVSFVPFVNKVLREALCVPRPVSLDPLLPPGT